MKGKKTKITKEAVKELEQSIPLIRAPDALQKDPSLIIPAKVKVSQEQMDKNVAMEE